MAISRLGDRTVHHEIAEVISSDNPTPDETLLRGYFHEPPRITDSTVLAHVHQKEILPTEIASAQNGHIDIASERVRRHGPNEWGLQWSSPLVPPASA